MRYACLTLVAWFLIAVQHVEGADSKPPVLDVVISDGKRLIQHWHESIYGKVWESAALAPLRSKLAQSAAEWTEKWGTNPLEQLSSLVNARFQLIGVTKVAEGEESPVTIRLQMDLGAAAPKLFAAVAKHATAVTLAGADEAVVDDTGLVTARVGSVILLMSKGLTIGDLDQIPVTAHDISIQFEGQALADATAIVMSNKPDNDKAKEQKISEIVKPLLTSVAASIDVVPNGCHFHMVAQTTVSWLKPVSQDWLAHVPDNAISFGGVGLDGADLWKTLIQPLLLASDDADQTDDGIENKINSALSSQGVDLTLADIVSGVKGTLFGMSTASMPIAGITLGIPHSPALDKLVAWGLTKINTDLPPPGQSVILGLPPTIPLSITLLNSHGHWVVSSDSQIAANWETPPKTDGADTPLRKLVKEKVGAGGVSFNVSDVATELKTLQGYAGMMLGQAHFELKDRQAILLGLSQLIANATPAYDVGTQNWKTLTWDGEGLFTSGSSTAVVAIIAAIAIPNLLESRVAASEAGAAATLKSSIFSAEVTYQAGNFSDRDKDGIGDYGFFQQMASGEHHLLPPIWNVAHPLVGHYYYAIYIPDGEGRALTVENDHDVAPALRGKGPETNFVVYAWPEKASYGRRIFAITTAGIVYSSLPTAQPVEPKWDDLFGNKGWEGHIVWQPYNQRHKSNAPKADAKTPPVTNQSKEALF